MFSKGDFLSAVAGRERAEAVTKVLYPSDEAEAGRELRLTQEYFLVACSVADVVRRFRERHGERWELFPEKVAIQLNDTHPALAVAELMRVFVDEADLPWEKAWALTRGTCGYTKHTLLAESLETWPVALMQRLIPRHVEILYDINTRFLEEVGTLHPGDPERLRRVSLVHGDGERRFRMAHLAIVGSHRINGVAQLHTELLKITSSATSPSCGRSGSWRSPTASRRGAGCWPATPVWRPRSPRASATAGSATWHVCGAAGARRRPGVPGRVPRHQAGEQERPGERGPYRVRS